jgi:hypothetical protein
VLLASDLPKLRAVPKSMKLELGDPESAARSQRDELRPNSLAAMWTSITGEEIGHDKSRTVPANMQQRRSNKPSARQIAMPKKG